MKRLFVASFLLLIMSLILETQVDALGNFCFDEYIRNPDFLNLKVGEHQVTLLLVGGDTANISFDMDNFKETIKYSGEKFMKEYDQKDIVFLGISFDKAQHILYLSAPRPSGNIVEIFNSL